MTLDLDAIEAAANEDKLTVGCVMLNPEHFDALLHIARQHDALRAKLAAAEALLAEALPILKPDAPLRWYVNDAVRDRISAFLAPRGDTR